MATCSNGTTPSLQLRLICAEQYREFESLTLSLNFRTADDVLQKWMENMSNANMEVQVGRVLDMAAAGSGDRHLEGTHEDDEILLLMAQMYSGVLKIADRGIIEWAMCGLLARIHETNGELLFEETLSLAGQKGEILGTMKKAKPREDGFAPGRLQDEYNDLKSRGWVPISTKSEGLMCGIYALTTSLKWQMKRDGIDDRPPTCKQLKALMDTEEYLSATGGFRDAARVNEFANTNNLSEDQLALVLLLYGDFVGRRYQLGVLYDKDGVTRGHLVSRNDAEGSTVVWVKNDNAQNYYVLGHWEGMGPRRRRPRISRRQRQERLKDDEQEEGNPGRN